MARSQKPAYAGFVVTGMLIRHQLSSTVIESSAASRFDPMCGSVPRESKPTLTMSGLESDRRDAYKGET